MKRLLVLLEIGGMQMKQWYYIIFYLTHQFSKFLRVGKDVGQRHFNVQLLEVKIITEF